uniref:snRNA-activating protein complex subunit 4 n=1 Tax=Anas platyrhynchos platyrhynchos TaxID=8840 RepID=U3IIX8_ANAPP
MELEAEREKIRREIEELERSLQPAGSGLDVSDCSLGSGTGLRALRARRARWRRCEEPLAQEVEKEEDSSDDDTVNSLPEDPETCLQMNHVYQEVIQEKIEEVELLIAQNKEQQKEIMCELDGTKTAKAADGRNLPANIFLGHFMKPYFKDKTTGIGPPSNEDAKEKAAQGIKSFEQLLSTKWKSREKVLLQKSVVSDRLQRLLQPKLLKLSYWNQKLEKVKTEMEKQILEKQIKEVEQEIEAINQLPESDLLGDRFDEHDWEKISNIHFDGQRSSEELRKFWQNYEHPSINKKEWTEEETERLKKIAAEHGYLDWQTIAQELGTNRTAFQCLQKYQAYNKDLKRKEWTRDEDLMLLELVQEMRVGSHIPYKKIAYYMEGRDSAQLIYRWTKSVDPSLKKGPWTPEEDAMLLAAVKKYGERDWYKIRTEVPGRSDAQCRDRYLKALHCDVKKGRWSLEEEEQLIDLVQKHGLGHWSKIASELPHRTGSQCLSKWKLMIGSKVLPAKRRHVEEESTSCSDSSSEDIELDLTDSSEEEITKKEECAFPSIDLWIPTQSSTQESNKGRYQTSSLFSSMSANARTSNSEVPRVLCDGGKDGVADKSAELNTILRGIARPHSTDITQSKMVKPFSTGLTKMSGAADQKLQGLQLKKSYRQKRERLKRINLDRKLLMAVTPWVGNVLLPCTLQTGKMAFHQTKAYAIQEKMKSISLSSTPLFTLFIQVGFTMLAVGWSKHAGTNQKPHLLSSPWLMCSACVALPSTVPPVQETSAAGLQSSAPVLAMQAALPAQAQRQKPKTVSELLKEKRLRESQAKAAMQRTVFIAPQVLVPGPLIIQQPPQQIVPSAQAGSTPGAVGCANSDVRFAPAQLPAFTSVAGPKVQSDKELNEQAPQSSPEGGGFPGLNPTGAEQASNQGGCNGQVLAGSSVPVVLQNQAFVPRQIARPGNFLPALVAPQAGSRLVPSSVLPFTWVVTPQALLPTSVQAVVGVPQGLPAAAVKSQSQASVMSDGSALGVAPVPAGANTPHPSSTETKAPSSQLAEGVPLGKATLENHSVSLLPVTSANPACSTPTVSSADASSKTSDCSAAQHSPPADAPALRAALLPQTQLPASTAGSDSHCAASSVSSEKNQDSSTPNASSSNPAIVTEGAVLQPRDPAPPNNVPKNSEGFAARVLKPRPIASKPPATQPAGGPPQPTTSSAGKTQLDFSLISLEDEEVVKEWLSGEQGVQVPPLQTRLPYFPPFLCNLKTLSRLLLQKAALEKQAACLLPSDGSRDEGAGVDLRAITELVHQKLGDDPAFLLLKARFLAAFTLPAVLATLSPPKVVTTLSGSRKQDDESDEEEWQSENESVLLTLQGMGAEEIAQSVSGSYTDVTDANAPQIRRSSRLRKRRRT